MATTPQATPKQTPAKQTARKTSKKTAKKSAARKSTAKATTPLLEREPLEVLETAGYALAGLAADAVGFARTLPERLDTVRTRVVKASEEGTQRVADTTTEGPERIKGTVDEVRGRIFEDLDTWRTGFEQVLDRKAAEGRKVTKKLVKDERVKKVLDQTATAREQVKEQVQAAVTSIRRVASDTAEQAGAPDETSSAS